MPAIGQLGEYIREQRRNAQYSLRQLAEAAGVSNPYLSQIERGLRKPSAEILQQIAKGLRISAEALYVQAGILDDKEGQTSVTEAIMADPEITERQKQMLIDIYESFRKEVEADAEDPAATGADEQADPPDPVTEAVEESGHDPLARTVAAAEAEPWTAPPAAGTG
jgi:transcriptional regulator with XRE-family HTH domain